MQEKPVHVAVLSPHRDDAAFSCGLTLHSLLEVGCRLTIVNVCTISRYAPYLMRGSGELTQQITGLRRREDTDFCNKLRQTAGAESNRIEFVDLSWQDVPIRWDMEDHLALASMSLPPEDVQKLREAFRALPQFDIVFVPMALGGHLDHRLVRQAAEQAFPASSVAFYEDLPYACRISAPSQAPPLLESHLALSEVWLPLQGAATGLKQTYALCYPSQIAVDVAEEMERYGLQHGGRERFLAGAEAVRLLRTVSQQPAGAVIA